MLCCENYWQLKIHTPVTEVSNPDTYGTTLYSQSVEALRVVP